MIFASPFCQTTCDGSIGSLASSEEMANGLAYGLVGYFFQEKT